MKKLAIACLGLTLCCLRPALAEEWPKDLQPIPDPDATNTTAPAASVDQEPEITIRNRGKDKVEEYRRNGRLYMIKITPRIGRPYYLVDPTGDGHFVRREGFDKGLVVPSWVLKTW